LKQRKNLDKIKKILHHEYNSAQPTVRGKTFGCIESADRREVIYTMAKKKKKKSKK